MHLQQTGWPTLAVLAGGRDMSGGPLPKHHCPCVLPKALSASFSTPGCAARDWLPAARTRSNGKQSTWKMHLLQKLLTFPIPKWPAACLSPATAGRNPAATEMTAKVVRTRTTESPGEISACAHLDRSNTFVSSSWHAILSDC